MTATTTRTLYDRQQAVIRQLRALGRNPAEWEPLDLALIAQIEAQIEILRDRVVIGLRDSGATDAEIGAAMGVTRQAVSKRWPGGGRFVGAAGRYRSARTGEHDDT